MAKFLSKMNINSYCNMINQNLKMIKVRKNLNIKIKNLLHGYLRRSLLYTFQVYVYINQY